MKKKLSLLVLISMLLLPMVMASVTLTAPAANAELTNKASYMFTATNASAVDNCTFAYIHQGSESYTVIGVNSTIASSTALFASTVPDSFGTNTFKVNCTINGTVIYGDDSLNVGISSYGSDETSEVSIDFIVGIGAAIVAFVDLIALLLLYNYIRKRSKFK